MTTEKTILQTVYVKSLRRGRSKTSDIVSSLQLPESSVLGTIKSMARKGFLRYAAPNVFLTEKGRRRFKVVFIGGAFEIIHPGHLHTIRAAKTMGDILVAVVARDSTVRKRKGREPITSEKLRLELLRSLRQVDVAILGSTGNIFDTLEKVKPDVVALGYDQRHDEAKIRTEAAARHLQVKVVRLDSPMPSIKTSKIIQTL